MSQFAKDTDVEVAQSRREIEATVTRYGADQFMFGWKDDSAVIAFRIESRQVRFILPIPDKSTREFTHTPTGQKRQEPAINKAYEQAIRQRWRALLLAVKAKLETVQSGIATFEEEFLAYVVLPNGQTYGEFAVPQIAAAYETGAMPEMLPMKALPASRG